MSFLRKARIKRPPALLILIIFFAATAFFLAGCWWPEHESRRSPGQESQGLLRVHFIDVGQGDAILVQFPDGKNLLVDAGSNERAGEVVSYLKKNGVQKLDFLLGTHPHEDHIGGLDAVIAAFEIGEFYMPKAVTGTNTYRDVLTAAKHKGLKLKEAKAGVELAAGEGYGARILAPAGAGYEELNDYSAVVKVWCGKVSFLLTGDAGLASEKEMLASGAELKAQVLKVAHHGSSSSTSAAFLRAVSPEYAVISVGAGNDYHHPHQATLERLKRAGAEILRTDERGTIIFSTGGNTLELVTQR